MAKASAGKTNINVNVLNETMSRIKEIQEHTFRSNVGDVIDAAVALLYAQESGIHIPVPMVGPAKLKNGTGV